MIWCAGVKDATNKKLLPASFSERESLGSQFRGPGRIDLPFLRPSTELVTSGKGASEIRGIPAARPEIDIRRGKAAVN